MVTNEYSQAAVEVLGLLNELEESEFLKIPKEIIKFLELNKSNTYNPNIDYSAGIDKIKLKEKTKEILAGIYLDYLCPENEKQDFINKIRKNDAKYQEEASINYNKNNIFKTSKSEYTIEKNTLAMMAEPKESIFKKIINKLRNLFSK